jgi:S-adenosylmethionine/arginine decarboxylase-like enzyme
MIPLRTWGKHLILDGAGAGGHTIRNPTLIYDFTKTLVKRIDMVAYGNPHIVRFGSGNKAGYTLVQLIETSNICAHFVEENNSMYLDVFSCKDFDPAVVKDTVEEYFEVKKMKIQVMTRQAPVDDVRPECLCLR